MLIARKTANLTQPELAKKIGNNPVNVSRWETGRTMPNADSFMAVLHACGFSVSPPVKVD